MARNSVASWSQLIDAESGHPPRLFIGPMPITTAKRIVPQIDTTKKAWWSLIRKRHRQPEGEESEGESDTESVPDVAAFRFFMHRGGRREEWSSRSLRQSVKRDMLRKFRQSDWASLFFPKPGEASPPKWVGDTFIIGTDFLGLPLEHPPLNPEDIPPVSPQDPPEPNVSSPVPRGSEETRNSKTLSTVSASPSMDNSTAGPSTSTTALVQPPPHSQAVRSFSDRPVVSSSSTSPPSLNATKSAPGIISLSTSTSRPVLLRPEAATNSGAGKSVQFTKSPRSASPTRVLNRSASSVPHTSAEASQAHSHMNRKLDDVFRRERMLVRIGYTKSGHVGRYFGAAEASRLRDLESFEWKEFLVVWRKQQLELYEDYTIPLKEKLLRHKYLAFIIPLGSATTGVSLYSFIDLTFCLSCTELATVQAKHPVYGRITNRLPFLRSTGTHLFVFKTKIRTSGIDWLWDLWNELGYDLPRTLEIHCPLVESFVRLRISENASQRRKETPFSTENVIEKCKRGLEGLASWDFLIGQRLEQGASLQLCWRNEAILDWIQWDTDLVGKPRDASVLYGQCLKRPNETTRLELRIGEHRAAYVMKDAEKILEPPSIEGYVHRVKLITGTRGLLYLSVHSGCLFLSSPSRGYPPTPPLPTDEEIPVYRSGEDTKASFEIEEKRRGVLQVLSSGVFIDLRKVTAVQRADPDNPTAIIDSLDRGGEEVLRKTPGRRRAGLRIRRCFEVIMENDRVYRFETHSCLIAQEWTDRLGELVDFWTRRHRADAIQEMKIMDAFTHRRDIHYSPGLPQPPSVNPDHLSEDISLFWNRCAVYGCHPITRAGRLFVRRKLRGQYSLGHFALVTGHMVQFDIVPSFRNPRSSTISLLDAYVCSGHFATQSLSVDEFSTIEPPLPRRFQDGLEIEDHELDLVFLIWYRPHAAKKTMIYGDAARIPAINAKHNIIVLKARSKLERDSWCWAINDEIERTARRHVSRELKLQAGNLMNI